MPQEPAEIADLLADLRLVGFKHAYIEATVKYTQGSRLPASSATVYGLYCGMCQGALAAHRFQVTTVPPREWMKTFTDKTAASMGRTKWKNHLASIARSLYPNNEINLPEADSVLIATYGQRQLTTATN